MWRNVTSARLAVCADSQMAGVRPDSQRGPAPQAVAPRPRAQSLEMVSEDGVCRWDGLGGVGPG